MKWLSMKWTDLPEAEVRQVWTVLAHEYITVGPRTQSLSSSRPAAEDALPASRSR